MEEVKKIGWDQVDLLFKDMDGWRIAETLLGLVLAIPNHLGYFVAHRSEIKQALPSKPQVFEIKTHIRFAKNQGDASFPIRKKKK